MTTIKETPGVQGGYPCVNDTRIAVSLLVECCRDYGLYAVYERWTWGGGLDREDVDYALDWYHRHPGRVDEDIERQRAAREALARS